jgi:V-type H+-transporting ATPase 21kDa proteolipid subunit
VAIILQTKIDWVPPSPDTGLWSNESYLAGYAIFASGLTTGWANLACGCALLLF